MNNAKPVISLPIEPGFLALRGLSPTQLRFGIEYRLGRGTTSNSFLFLPHNQSQTLLVHPPGYSFSEPYTKELNKILKLAGLNKNSIIYLVIGNVNPNRIMYLHELVDLWPNIILITSNPGAQLLTALWDKHRPNLGKVTDISSKTSVTLPKMEIVKTEEVRELSFGHRIRLIPTATPRWPEGLMVFEESTGLLMSGKFFASHICTEVFAETNRLSTEEDRRYFYDCLMAPMARQVNTIVERVEELDIRSIAPTHGPVISESWRSLLSDYRRWSETQERSKIKIGLLFASAYGNTAIIADALAQGISRTKVQVEILNCEFASSTQMLDVIHKSDALLIGSPTLGGHAPTPILTALGAILSEGNRDKPIGIFGSYGWSGEAIDLLQTKLTDGGFTFAFDPIRIKFSPTPAMIKTIEETGVALARRLQNAQNKQERLISAKFNDSKDSSAMLALGRVVGPLCILTVSKGEGVDQVNGAMVASWVSQASFNPPGFTVAVAKDRSVETLLHIGDRFVINILAKSREIALMKQFLQPFEPGINRFTGLNLEKTPKGQLLIPEALAWLESIVCQRMECNDHWVIYAQVEHGGLLDDQSTTAVHQRRSGANY
ncbi:putative flavoprotein (chromatophore) [Paulinella micropora]|uniref:Flavoprotein n=1 Tax=Paulinella micropora TaxID=1928728 RepID=A0A1L5YBS0_9EUKA|nr:putative flavoprotein [Paulinella micropora]AQX44917.1 putative flavoprotein [Paulinella micropora]BBL86131.1 putative flavoprotein [Paulinella micropora]